ncbi:Adenine DNA glycosylase [bacterium HR40]|nr:Adenine DNA glycosylase [bacterium HR40]
MSVAARPCQAQLEVSEARERLLAWYEIHRRELPWRSPAYASDPWAVLVSEFMLQQTTAATVAGRFERLLDRFPTAADLAAASFDDVLHAWQGLGYYRRARHLHACARAICERHGGKVPDDAEALRRLPGIGPYTAAAVAAIAFGRPEVPLDANVMRVLARFFAIDRPLARARRELRQAAAAFASPERAGDLAQGLMELGALICRPRRPDCRACPLARSCRAHRLGIAARLPVRPAAKNREQLSTLAYLAVDAAGRVLLRRRPEDGLLGGLFELPGEPWRKAESDEAPIAPPCPGCWRPVAGEVRHLFTHIELRVQLLRADLAEECPPTSEGHWYEASQLADLPLSSLTRRLLRHGGYDRLPPSPGRQASGR